MIELELILTNSNSDFLNTAIGGAIVGGVISLLIAALTLSFNYKRNKEEDIRNTLYLLSEKYSKLFTYIYKMANDYNNIELIEFWSEFEKHYFNYLLPSKMRKLFVELKELRDKGSDNYTKEDISSKCKKIISSLENFGVDLFG